jgi:hypothetical protein
MPESLKKGAAKGPNGPQLVGEGLWMTLSFWWNMRTRWAPWIAKRFILVLTLRPALDKGPEFNFLGTNLNWFEANWILELDCTLVPSLILGSSKSGALRLGMFFGLNQLNFRPKQVPCRFSLNLPLFGFGSSLKRPWDQYKAGPQQHAVDK